MNVKGGFQFININIDNLDLSGDVPTLKIDGIYDKLESNRGKPIYLTLESQGNKFGCVVALSKEADGTAYVLNFPLSISPENNVIINTMYKIDSEDNVTQYVKVIAMENLG